MTYVRWLATIFCFAFGYWLVSMLINRSSAPRPKENTGEPASEREGTVPGRSDIHERATLSNWYRILDVPEGAGKEQIAAAYKRKIAQYHPDKVAQMGSEIRDVADAKSKQINAAYDLGMRLFR